jgi:pimeloyl-ACP methyl ester carboxylesterase
MNLKQLHRELKVYNRTGSRRQLFHALSAAMVFLLLISSLVTAQSNSMTPQDKFVTVYGQKIHYLEAGSGSVVLLLHGLGSDTSDWSKVIAPLSKHYRVLAPDQIGAGQSDKPFINYRPMTWVDFIGGFYQALKIEHASLVGHSMGGATAAMFAIAHPEQVERLVLVDAGYGYAIPEGLTPAS